MVATVVDATTNGAGVKQDASIQGGTATAHAAAPPSTITTTRRVNVNFTGDAYEVLEQLAASRGKSISDVLRDAVALERWIEENRQAGARILIERDGKTRELVWL